MAQKNDYQRRFGEIPNQPVGTVYKLRESVKAAGLHGHLRAGISGTPHEGADAIVLSGGYEDDGDDGDVITYTGQGGRDPRTKKQIEDQDFAVSGNAALIKSQQEGLPVRVIRQIKPKPDPWYRYDGLYWVSDSWYKRRSDGFRVCQFLLEAENPNTPVGSGVQGSVGDAGGVDAAVGTSAQAASDGGSPSWAVRRIIKFVRDPAVVRRVKSWYENHCQVCGEVIMLPNGGFSNGAHIRPLSRPHNGPDDESNMLCLCPNDHQRFDFMAIYITDDMRVVDALNGGVVISQLRVDRRHYINLDHVRYHRRSIVGMAQ
ncbi:YDG/SRA domain-containing protein [Nocardiopsis coralliicola]